MRTIYAYECPIDGCAWKLSVTDLEVLRMTAGPKFRAKITVGEDGSRLIDSSEYTRESAKFTEGIFRRHLKTHDVLDLMRTVQRLNQDLAQFDSGIRPHVYANHHRYEG